MPRFHHTSEYGPGPRVALDRERRAVWKARVELARRAGRITAAHALVALAMLRRLGASGQCDPSHATIAADAGVSDRTVRRALDGLADCGLVRWVRRLVRDGWRTSQTANAYALVIVDTPAIPRVRCGGQAGRQTLSDRFSTVERADQAARESAARQLAALGCAVPAGWST